MILISEYITSEVIKILRDEVDEPPSLFRCLVTLNAHYYSGTSSVCGTVTEAGFELRNRNGPAFSLRAYGTLAGIKAGTEIRIKFKKPFFSDFIGVVLFNRYSHDKKKILSFLEQYLKAKEITEQGFARGSGKERRSP
jgi:hypothetical protein